MKIDDAVKTKRGVLTGLPDGVRSTFYNLLHVKQRVPVLRAFVDELARRRTMLLLHARQEGFDDAPPQNDIILQILNDSYDLLVIDLASIREGMCKSGGILNQLRDQPSLLHRWRPEEVTPSPILHVTRDHSAEAPMREWEQQKTSSAFNAAFDRLVPGAGLVVSTADVNELINRFREETAAIDQDRNRTRAHRFEGRTFDPKHYIPLMEIEPHIEAMVRVLRDLLLVLAGHSSNDELKFMSSEESTAADLADLTAFSSIGQCVDHYLQPWSSYDQAREAALNTTDGVSYHLVQFLPDPLTETAITIGPRRLGP